MLGAGSGRNLPPLLAAGLTVDVAEPDAARRAAASDRFACDVAAGRLRLDTAVENVRRDLAYDALLSTHGLLHGTADEVAKRLARAGERLARGGDLFATFGSPADARFAAGRRLDAATWVPASGDETGVVHASFGRAALLALLASFDLAFLGERDVSRKIGRWAHGEAERGIVHWFAVGKKR